MGFGEWVGRVDKLQGTYVYLCFSILRTEPLGVQALASIGEIKNNTIVLYLGFEFEGFDSSKGSRDRQLTSCQGRVDVDILYDGSRNMVWVFP